jgi:uncharacterized protein YwqG
VTERFEQLLQKWGLVKYQENLIGQSRPGIRLDCAQAGGDDAIPVGVSKMGGLPDLPPDVDWPKWKGRSLDFLLQLSMAELRDCRASADLPKRGLLSFFYDPEQETWGFDPEDGGSWRVFYFDGPVKVLERRPAPAKKSQSSTYKAFRLRFQEVLTLMPLTEEMIESLENGWDSHMDFVSDLVGDKPLHQVLGHPAEIQGEMRLECQLAANGVYCGDGTEETHPRYAELTRGTEDWRLLLQVDSDDAAGMMWGDCGRLYFWIKEQDLAQSNFDNVWMILQCY